MTFCNQFHKEVTERKIVFWTKNANPTPQVSIDTYMAAFCAEKFLIWQAAKPSDRKSHEKALGKAQKSDAEGKCLKLF